jgi:hypothetical protein
MTAGANPSGTFWSPALSDVITLPMGGVRSGVLV